MKLNEAEKLLIEMSAIDNRIVSDLSITAWAEVLGGMTYADARAALLEHRRTSSEYVTPAHLIAIGTPKRDPDAWMNRSIK
jgi:hypothetical protein